MVCFLCFDDSPTGDERDAYGRQWQTPMKSAPCAEPGCYAIACCCPGPVACYLRKEILDGDMGRYTCCQGYFDCCCFKAGRLGEEQCPEGYLCVESIFCTHFAIQANRFHMMDSRGIQPDPCDNQIIRCYNMMVCLQCIFELAACISGNDELRDAAAMIRFITDLMYATIMPCMAAQVKAELNAEASGKAAKPAGAPTNMVMERGAPAPMTPALAQPQQHQPVAVAQPAAQPMAQPMAQPFMVSVPPGLAPGQQIMVQSPYTGQQLAVAVPPGMQPGQQFQVMG